MSDIACLLELTGDRRLRLLIQILVCLRRLRGCVVLQCSNICSVLSVVYKCATSVLVKFSTLLDILNFQTLKVEKKKFRRVAAKLLLTTHIGKLTKVDEVQ
jgi:hypothetical protein